MQNSDSQSRKRKAECLEINNHEVVHNQAANQTVHGSQYFGNVNYYNNVPAAKPDELISAGVLASLAFAGMLDRKGSIAQPCYGTCIWIFDLNEYRDWRESSRGLLWIKGKPGSGKSTMMSFLFQKLCAEDHKAEGEVSSEHSVKNALSLHFFFNARGGELQHTTVGMLRSLLHQLLRKCPSAGTSVTATYREKHGTYGTDLQAWNWQQSELEQLLCDALMASSLHRPITVFIDALDEAREHAAQHIARYIHRVNDVAATLRGNDDGRKGCLKFCISSRHYPVASAVKGLEIWMEKYNRNDMKIFIDKEFNDSGWSAEDVDKFNQLKSYMSNRAEGVFQWVSLIVPMLLHEYANGWLLEDIETYLDKLPQDLEDIYVRIIRSLDRSRISESFLLFKWVHLAYRPLLAIEVMSVLSSDGCSLTLNEDVMARRIRALSGGLIAIADSKDPLDIGPEYSEHPSDTGPEDPRDPWDTELRGFIDSWGTGSEDSKDPLDIELEESMDSASITSKIWNTVQVIHQTVGEFLAQKGLQLLSCLCDGRDEDLILLHDYDQTALIQECHSTIYWHCLNYFTRIEFETIEPLGKKFERYHFDTYFETYSVKGVREEIEKDTGLWLIDYATVHVFHHGRQASDHDCLGDCRHPNRQSEIEMLERMRLHWIMSFCVIIALDASRAGVLEPDYTWSIIHIAAAFDLDGVIGFLIGTGHTVSLQDDRGNMPLHIACRSGSLKTCEKMLGIGVPVNSLNKSRDSPLCLAAMKGHIAIMILLLDNGAKIDLVGAKGHTALREAAYCGHYAALRLLVEKGADLNARGNYLGEIIQQVLMKVESNDQIETVRFLLAAGANINLNGSDYIEALHEAASRSVRAVRLLLAAGADANVSRPDFRHPKTAISEAAKAGNIEVMQLLLEVGVDVNVYHEDTGTTLQIAICYCSEDLASIRWLLHAGADVNAKGGRTFGNALCAASLSGMHGLDGILKKQILQTLLDAGARLPEGRDT